MFSVGSSRASWSCYFFPETSQECRDRAFDLLGSDEAWKRGIITAKENYSSKEIWTGRTPRQATAYLSIELNLLSDPFFISLMSIVSAGYGVILGLICNQQQK